MKPEKARTYCIMLKIKKNTLKLEYVIFTCTCTR